MANHPYISYGGGYAHLKLTYNTGGNIVFYTMGTILKKRMVFGQGITQDLDLRQRET